MALVEELLSYRWLCMRRLKEKRAEREKLEEKDYK